MSGTPVGRTDVRPTSRLSTGRTDVRPTGTERIGVFGGSFDPPHIGHLICAKSVANQLSLSKVLVIPAAEQPLKPEGASAPPETRLKMVEALFRDDPLFEISRIEIDRGGESFTIDTLRELKQGQAELFLIVGADILADMPRWKEPDEIFKLAKVAVMTRPGAILPKLPDPWQQSIISVATPLIDVSSSIIRRRVHEGKDISQQVPHEVEKIIRFERLYT